MAQIPIAIWLADKLEDPESTHGYRLVANNSANELRRLHEEIQSLKAQRKPLSVEQIAELDCNDHYKFARAIEAAHGIKENK